MAPSTRYGLKLLKYSLEKAREMGIGALCMEGNIDFYKNPEAFEAYESTFPAKEKDFNEQQLPQFCQSCGMPLTNKEDCGTNADGSVSFAFCKYCCKDGATPHANQSTTITNDGKNF